MQQDNGRLRGVSGLAVEESQPRNVSGPKVHKAVFSALQSRLDHSPVVVCRLERPSCRAVGSCTPVDSSVTIPPFHATGSAQFGEFRPQDVHTKLISHADPLRHEPVQE